VALGPVEIRPIRARLPGGPLRRTLCLSGGTGADAERAAGDSLHDASFVQTVRDASTSASIKLSLAFERGVKASHITVHTDRGTVTLAGEVDSQAERQLAARIAHDTEGVKHVVNQLQVRG